MARVQIDSQHFDVDLAVFDKDGTLVAFQPLWGGRVVRWVEWLVAHTNVAPTLEAALFRTIGYDKGADRVVEDGPYAVAPTPVLMGVACAVLYQHDIPWSECESLVEESGELIFGAPPTPEEIQPIGDVVGTMARLHEAGVKIVVATSDTRKMCELTMPLLGIEEQVSMFVCGDDGRPGKPNPAGLHHASQSLGIPLSRTIMVGDATGDMNFGRRAGVAGCVGIAGGAGNQTRLRQSADVVIGSIDEIRIV